MLTKSCKLRGNSFPKVWMGQNQHFSAINKTVWDIITKGNNNFNLSPAALHSKKWGGDITNLDAI